MKGDFTRWTFDPENRFTRVLEQQGRVQLDADWNEQAAILLHHLRTLTEDLIGPYGAPANPDGTAGNGFRPVVVAEPGKLPAFRLLPGRYYVGGYLVENREGERVYADVEPWPPQTKPVLLYLDVWEELITYVQDDRIREVALGGVDTAARARVAFRVKAREVDAKTCLGRRDWNALVEELQPANRGLLKAEARRKDGKDGDNPCIASPEARYTGVENQLYRVEIHQGGTAKEGATFKWSRENGSVVFPVELEKAVKASADAKTHTVTLEHLGRDGRFGLAKGDWVEALDDNSEDGQNPLLRVESGDADRLQVTLQGKLPVLTASENPYLRRWDQKNQKANPETYAGEPVKEGEDSWIDLEDGIRIAFAPAPSGAAHTYRAGDYWLIPARTATGDVEWPLETKPVDGKLVDGKPMEGAKALAPHGVEHRYAPLGLATTLADGTLRIEDCRKTFGEQLLILDTGTADWWVTAVPEGPFPPPLPPFPPPPPSRRADEVTEPHSAWAELPPARWISVDPDQRSRNLPKGPYTYELKFDLCAGGRNVTLSLSLLADNSAEVFLNAGNKPILKHPGPRGFVEPVSGTLVNPTGLVLPGENTLRVVVQNQEEGVEALVTGFALRGSVELGCC